MNGRDQVVLLCVRRTCVRSLLKYPNPEIWPVHANQISNTNNENDPPKRINFWHVYAELIHPSFSFLTKHEEISFFSPLCHIFATNANVSCSVGVDWRIRQIGLATNFCAMTHKISCLTIWPISNCTLYWYYVPRVKLGLCASHRELLFISKVYIAELPQPDEIISAQHNK